jgi:RNA polymerase sigma-70 factor (ECF subfamily)
MNQVYAQLDTYFPHLRRYALTLCRNRADAEDLVQECAARALDKSEKFEPGTNLRAWLLTMMHNLHVSRLRKAGNNMQSIDAEMVPSVLSEKPRQGEHVVLQEVRHALGRLPREQRITLEMAVLDGRPYEDIARSQRVSVGTIKSRVARSRQSLRAMLDGDSAISVRPDLHPEGGRPAELPLTPYY